MLFDKQDNSTMSAKEKILLTAHRLFYIQGIKNTGVDRIIMEAKVTKVTFYRHFPSKNELVLSYLEYRHQRWVEWFEKTLDEQISLQSSVVKAILATMEIWFCEPDFRGCAFINATAEAGELISHVQKISRDHKAKMAEVLNKRLPIENIELAHQLVLLLDGAVIHMQMGVPLARILLLTDTALCALVE